MKVNAIKKYKLQKSMSSTGLEVMLEPEIQHLHNKENIKLVVPLIYDWEKSFAASDDSYQPKSKKEIEAELQDPHYFQEAWTEQVLCENIPNGFISPNMVRHLHGTPEDKFVFD